MEHKSSLKHGKRSTKQRPGRSTPQVFVEIKIEFERLLKSNFLRTAMCVNWILNVVLVIKKIDN